MTQFVEEPHKGVGWGGGGGVTVSTEMRGITGCTWRGNIMCTVLGGVFVQLLNVHCAP